MISENTRNLDRDDVAVLFAAMVNYEREHGDDLDRSMVAVGYGFALDCCELAATIIAAEHEEEGDEWDGVVWFECLERTGDSSLAAHLYMLESDEPDIKEKVHAVTMQWLKALEG